MSFTTSFTVILLYLPALPLGSTLLKANFDPEVCIQVGTAVNFSCGIYDPDGRGVTIWKGTPLIFNCPSMSSVTNDQVYLRHSQLTNMTQPVGECGDLVSGVLQSVTENETYISDLFIATTLEMNNGGVLCTDINEQDSQQLQLQVEGIPPSPQLHLSLNNGTFSVTWDAVETNTDREVHYITEVSDQVNCGICSNIGNVTSNIREVTCFIRERLEQTCNVSVTAVISDCPSFKSATVSLSLMSPIPPTLQRVVPMYSQTGRLEAINITLIHSMNVESGHYQVDLTGTDTTYYCSNQFPIIIDCEMGQTCEQEVTIDCTFPSANEGRGFLSISAFTKTVLGNSLVTTYPRLIEYSNSFIKVEVVSASSSAESFTIVAITFADTYSRVYAAIEYGTKCNNFNSQETIVGLERSTIRFATISNNFSCYVITANNGSQYLSVRGLYIEPTDYLLPTLYSINAILLLFLFILWGVSIYRYCRLVRSRRESTMNCRTCLKVLSFSKNRSKSYETTEL